jgi:hypothetical protein
LLTPMAPPPRNKELAVVEFPDGSTIVLPDKQTAFYRALYGPIGTIAYTVCKGEKTLIVKRTPDPDAGDPDT